MPYEKAAIAAAVLIAILAIGYGLNHYGNLREQAKVAEGLEDDNKKLVADKEETERQITLNEDEKKAFDDMIAKAKQEKQTDDKVILEHDLDVLLQAKPGLVINRVNAGTERMFEDISAIYAD